MGGICDVVVCGRRVVSRWVGDGGVWWVGGWGGEGGGGGGEERKGGGSPVRGDLPGLSGSFSGDGESYAPSLLL